MQVPLNSKRFIFDKMCLYTLLLGALLNLHKLLLNVHLQDQALSLLTFHYRMSLVHLGRCRLLRLAATLLGLIRIRPFTSPAIHRLRSQEMSWGPFACKGCTLLVSSSPSHGSCCSYLFKNPCSVAFSQLLVKYFICCSYKKWPFQQVQQLIIWCLKSVFLFLSNMIASNNSIYLTRRAWCFKLFSKAA